MDKTGVKDVEVRRVEPQPSQSSRRFGFNQEVGTRSQFFELALSLG